MKNRRDQAYLDALIPAPENRRITSEAWRRMDPQQRIEELTGHSLDRCRDILDLPIEMCVRSPTVMNGQINVIRAILNVVTRVGIESTRLRQMQEEVLGQLIEDFDNEAERRNRGNGHAR